MSRITLGRNRVKGQLCIEPAMEPMEERLLLSGTGHVLSFEPAVQYANGGTSAICAVAGDFDNDGKLDLITANPDAGTLSLFPGNGDGTFGTATSIPSGTIPSSVAAADFNGDGKLDLVVTNLSSSQVMVYMGNGDGTFQRGGLFVGRERARRHRDGRFQRRWKGGLRGCRLGWDRHVPRQRQRNVHRVGLRFDP